jgi:hypothetical protein
MATRNTNWGAGGTNGNLSSPQGIKLPVASKSSQYTAKRSFYTESSPEVENQPFYMRS